MQFKFEEIVRFNSKLVKEFNISNDESPNVDQIRSEFKSYASAILNAIKQLQSKAWSNERDLILEKENNIFLQKKYENQLKRDQMLEVELIKERKLNEQIKNTNNSFNDQEMLREKQKLKHFLLEQEKSIKRNEMEIAEYKTQIKILNQEIYNLRVSLLNKKKFSESNNQSKFLFFKFYAGLIQGFKFFSYFKL